MPNGASPLERALKKWRADRSDVNALAVEAAGREVAAEYGPGDWDLAVFDHRTPSRVLDWFETAQDELVLPCLRQLQKVLPDPRMTEPLLKLLERNLERPLERALTYKALEANGVTLKGDRSAMLEFAERRDQMLHAMFMQPDDLALRRVTADWLMEHGDPLGELMALQLSGREDTKEREAELMRAHGRAWMHDLFFPEPVRDVRFEQGVPVHIMVPRRIRWSPPCVTIRSVQTLGGSEWLLGPPWKRVKRIRPWVQVPGGELGGRGAEVLAQLAEVEISHRRAALFTRLDGNLEVYAWEAPVPYGLVLEVLKLVGPKRVELVLPPGEAPPEALREAAVRHLSAGEIRALAARVEYHS